MPSKYDEGRFYVPDNVGRRIDQWLDGKFFLYNNGYGTKAEQILHDMEEPYKEVFMLSVLGGFSLKDISAIFGKSESWARVTFHRAKQKLLERMGEK
mgnify:CR=1 FL=1